MTEIIAIVQARMGSTRLPGKVMMNLIGKPMLAHELSRIARSKRISSIVVATTTSHSDDCIVDLCKEHDCIFSEAVNPMFLIATTNVRNNSVPILSSGSLLIVH